MTARYANVSEVPLALAVFLASDDYDYIDDPHTISTTTLLKPLRQIILASRVPEGEALPKLADMMKLRMGSAIHGGIEHSWKNNYRDAMSALGLPARVIDKVRINPLDQDLTDDVIPIYVEDVRFKRKLGKWTITGKADFIGDGRVQDFKSTSVFVYMKQTNALKFTQQGSIYRWLDPKKITQDEMDIHYIFTDHKASMVRSDPNYPPRPFLQQRYPLMSLRETERFIANKLALIEQYWDAPEDDIPLCDPDELWRSEPVFKYYKNPDKTARSTKNYDTKQEAMLRFIEDGSKGLVKEVPGQVTACKYCNAFSVCSQKDALIQSGDLIMY